MASSAPNFSHPIPKATWDESNTGILLDILVQEIEAGNRPAGHFTKLAWNQIVQKFCQSSGCNFSLTQLRNKFDNMKKDFGIWEKLRNDETGLGYDRSTNRIVADPVWWRQKIQDCPDYKRFKTHGPMHLELQERVFRGIVATGYMEYAHQYDPLCDRASTIDKLVHNFSVEDLHISDNEPVLPESEPDICNATSNPKPNLTTRKRKRKQTNKGTTSDADVNNSLLEYINLLKQEKESVNSPGDVNDKTLTHTEAIQLLRAQPWIQIPSQLFSDALLLFKDMTHRVTFANIVDLGEQVVNDWIRTEMRYSHHAV